MKAHEMKNIISYALWGKDPRYTGNIAWTIIANSAIYPEYISRFYVHHESLELRECKLLAMASQKFPDLVEVEVLNEKVIGTKFTAWRMKPLWEKNTRMLLCRDLDHITNTPERRSVEWFCKNSDKMIHSIRSYALHTVPYMAGLCGFKSHLVRAHIWKYVSNFDKYIAWGEKKIKYCKDGWIWGCDQALLRDFFGHHGMYPHTLDCPQFTAPKSIGGFNATSLDISYYKDIDVPQCNHAALKYSNKIAPGFTGAACDATTDQMNILIEIVNNDIAKMVKGFYA